MSAATSHPTSTVSCHGHEPRDREDRDRARGEGEDDPAACRLEADSSLPILAHGKEGEHDHDDHPGDREADRGVRQVHLADLVERVVADARAHARCRSRT